MPNNEIDIIECIDKLYEIAKLQNEEVKIIKDEIDRINVRLQKLEGTTYKYDIGEQHLDIKMLKQTVDNIQHYLQIMGDIRR